jgi:hypothetical protein
MKLGSKSKFNKAFKADSQRVAFLVQIGLSVYGAKVLVR